MVRDLDVVLGWIREVDAEPLAAKIVAGASLLERRHLAALGGLVAAIVPRRSLELWPSDVLEWVNDGPVPPAETINAAARAISQDPTSTLAQLYGHLVCSVNRRYLGTFFTPAPEVDLMLDMWQDAEHDPATVVDVGAGVGVFTVAAARRWPKAKIHAVDINPVTLGLLGLRAHAGDIALQRDSTNDAGIRLIHDDYTCWADTLPANDNPRLVLGNPPYTRSQLLTVGERLRLQALAGGLCGSRASLSALITAISLQRLQSRDGLSLLLPAQWLEADYARPLRNYLAGLTSRRIELRLVDSQLFPDALVDAVVLQVGRQRQANQAVQIATRTPGARDQHMRAVDRTELVDRPWRHLFATDRKPALPTKPARSSPANGEFTLSQYCRIRRGTATGANEFFLLTEEQVGRLNLDDAVVRLIRRLGNYPNVATMSAHNSVPRRDRRWLLNVVAEDRIPGGPVDRYLRTGESHGVDQRYLCAARRSNWYDLNHDLVVPDVIIGPMARHSIKIVENEIGAAITNNLYGWTWHHGVAAETRSALLAWLRSAEGQAALIAVTRKRGAGLQKLEPRALAELVISRSLPAPPRTP